MFPAFQRNFKEAFDTVSQNFHCQTPKGMNEQYSQSLSLGQETSEMFSLPYEVFIIPHPLLHTVHFKQLNICTVSMQMRHQYPLYSSLLRVQDDG